MLDSTQTENTRSELSISGELSRSALYNNVFDFAKALSQNTNSFIPVGSISAFCGNTPPAKFLFCDGSVYQQSQYPNLFSVISTTFNIGGETATQFRIPDLRGRAVFGRDNMGGTAQNRITFSSGIFGTLLGYPGGSQFLMSHTHNYYDNGHGHTRYDPGHAHNYWYHRSLAGYGRPTPQSGNTVYIDDYGKAMSYEGCGISIQSRTTGVTINNNGSGTTSSQNMPPAIILNWVIKT